jgi:hypothetical protein
MRIRVILASAAATAPLAAVGVATAAHASTPATASTKITGRLDSGYAGNNWASDTITRTITAAEAGNAPSLDDCGDVTACYAYTGTITDTGTAHAITGQTSPGAQGVAIKGSPNAAINGHATVTFFASAKAPNPTLVPATATGNAETTTDWIEQFFPAGTAFGAGPSLTTWNWTYSDSADCQTWVDAYNGTKATSGDITGVDHCPILSGGHATAGNTRASVTWKSTVTAAFEVTITGPGKLNGRMGKVGKPEAVYSGLESGHTYSVKIQPLVNGVAEGKSGRVDLVTTRS